MNKTQTVSLEELEKLLDGCPDEDEEIEEVIESKTFTISELREALRCRILNEEDNVCLPTSVIADILNVNKNNSSIKSKRFYESHVNNLGSDSREVFLKYLNLEEVEHIVQFGLVYHVEYEDEKKAIVSKFDTFYFTNTYYVINKELKKIEHISEERNAYTGDEKAVFTKNGLMTFYEII